MDINSTLTLNNGVRIPSLGFGTYKAGPGEGTENAVAWALEAGYRHIDGAWFYGNEAETAVALRKSGIARDEVFITSKVWNDDHGYENAQEACRRGLERMGLEAFDLYLIHWPVRDKWQSTWQGLEELYRQGKCRAVGVSNFSVKQLTELLSFAKVKPAVNQIEVTPFNQRRDIVQFCESNGIAVECFSPLARGARFDHPALVDIATCYNITPAQIMIRWGLQKGYITLPKSATKERIIKNAQVYDFCLSYDDMNRLDGLDDGFSCMKPEWVAQFV